MSKGSEEVIITYRGGQKTKPEKGVYYRLQVRALIGVQIVTLVQHSVDDKMNELADGLHALGFDAWVERVELLND